LADKKGIQNRMVGLIILGIVALIVGILFVTGLVSQTTQSAGSISEGFENIIEGSGISP